MHNLLPGCAEVSNILSEFSCNQSGKLLQLLLLKVQFPEVTSSEVVTISFNEKLENFEGDFPSVSGYINHSHNFLPNFRNITWYFKGRNRVEREQDALESCASCVQLNISLQPLCQGLCHFCMTF
ncbi:hypothetical protein ILYODFUR_020586 [Ilyodon furcidens]|uniref:Uncharacterized protein n=1 Tax=Ilyodon furcidens TaxID=33524 RepID=A0ABV0TXF0_9TELE